MDTPFPLEEIFTIKDPSVLAEELRTHVLYKLSLDWRSLTETEKLFYSLGDLLYLHTWMEFCDIFYQQHSLKECRSIECALREMSLSSLADLFAEALAIYCRHSTVLSEEDFKKLEPFDLSDDDGKRFDAIGQLFRPDSTEICKLPERLGCYAMEHRDSFHSIPAPAR